MRRLLALLSLLLAAALLMAPSASANEPPPGDGPGPGREPWVAKPIFQHGDPAKVRIKSCRMLLQGPYTRAGDNFAHGRLECTNLLYLNGGLQVFLHRDDHKAGAESKEKACNRVEHTVRVVRGVRWYGCTVTATVSDDRGLVPWIARFGVAETNPRFSETVVGKPVDWKCRTSAEKWCDENPRKVAIHRVSL